MTGDNGRTLWDAVNWLAPPGKTSWLFAADLRALLIVSDWFSLIESGEHWTGGQDQTAELEAAHGGEQPFGGYVVDSEPPSLVLCRVRRTGATLQMASVKNWGIEHWAQLAAPDGSYPTAADLEPTSYARSQDTAKARARAVAYFVASWTSFVQAARLGPLKPTCAAQAMSGYRTSYMRDTILCHQNDTVKRMERAAYYPGRCEPFRLGDCYGPIYHLDARSFYPFLARQHTCPVRLSRVATGTVGQAAELCKLGWHLICECTIRARRADYPFRRSDGICYPIGTFNTVLCAPELEGALIRDEVLDVCRMAVYEPGDALSRWVDGSNSAIAALPTSATPAMRVAVKALRNSIFGAFAKRVRRWKESKDSPSPLPYYSWWQDLPESERPAVEVDENGRPEPWATSPSQLPLVRWRATAWKVEYETADVEYKDGAIAIAAWVNSLGRAALLVWLRAAGEGNVFYTDTDSLWVNQAGYDNLERAGLLGQTEYGDLRLVAKHNCMVIHGAKAYTAGVRGVYAGVPTDALVTSKGKRQWWCFEQLASARRNGSRPQALYVKRSLLPQAKWSGGQLMQDGSILPLYVNDGR